MNKKKAIGIAVKIVGGIVLLFTVILIGMTIFFSFGGEAPNIFGYNIYLMKTNAFGVLNEGTAIITQEIIPDKIVPGDIVVYSEKNSVLISHVTKSDLSEEFYTFSGIDPEGGDVEFTGAQIIGKATMKSSFLGAVASFAVSPTGMLFIAIIPCLLLLGFEVYRYIRSKYPSERIEPIKKQDEIPTYVPIPKDKPGEYEGDGTKDTVKRNAQMLKAYKDIQGVDDSEKPLPFVPKVPKSEPKQKPEEKKREMPLSSEKLSRAIEETNMKRREHEAVGQNPIDFSHLSLPPKTKAVPAEPVESADVKAYVPKQKTSERTSSLPRLDAILKDDGSESFDIDDILAGIERKRHR